MNFDSRKYVIVAFFVLTGVLYAIKLFYMQVVDDSWKLRAQQIAEHRREITPPRAVVFDRNGLKVVENKTYYNLMMVEGDVSEDMDTMAFAELIGWTKQEIIDRYKQIVKGEGTYTDPFTKKVTKNYQDVRAYPFIKELTADEMAKIAPHLENFKGFYEEVASMRNYPYANGANILGYLSEATREEVDEDPFYRPGDKIGRAGIERYYEDEFRGSKGVKYIVRSARLNAVASFEDGKYDTTAMQGDPIHLGLDINLQDYGEQLLQNKKGCIVPIDPKTGEILALVSAPSFDPNLLVGNKKIRRNYPALLEDLNKPLFPRPLASEYMPGSTFKLLQSLIGMQEGVITKDSGFPCNKGVVGCHNHPSAQNVTQAVKMSCNPYYYAVARRIIQQGKDKSSFKDSEIGLQVWADYMHSFGLGVKLDTDITGLRAGNIPDPAYYDRWRGKGTWKFSAIQSISIGQGEVQLTPLQLANVAAIMANRGWYYTPHFVKSIGDNGPLDKYRKKNYTMVDAKHFPPVIEGMRGCVHDAGGTARLARIDGLTMCGKTGTVENYYRGVKQKNHSVFIAFAPMDDPKIAIAVFIENAGGGGGTWAAPTASLMIEQYLYGEVKSTAKEKRILDAKLSNWEE
ncbi:MAG: penicillin-binding transpeptidase domain-containing protein [Crocinitomicaceae bacterium]|nr:penicillin-binding transpeptidase domain-containing protein [Crocinitomicaceae bacterium]